MKLLIIGHARHGKDTVADIFHIHMGLRFQSSSWCIAKLIHKDMNYSTVKDCYKDRSNHRKFWFDWIDNFNTPDASRLCREILENNDMYVGMRSQRELTATKHLFDLIIWIDASDRHPSESVESMKLISSQADIIVDNNQDLIELETKVKKLIGVMK